MMIAIDELKRRVRRGYAALSFCRLCPRDCGVDRLHGELGVCHTGKVASVASHNAHMGEEPPITGDRGSGTIFFSSCNLRCKFCQNYPISQLGNGEEAPPYKLGRMMLSLQERGCHNINVVTGSHVVPQFLAGLYTAKKSSTLSPPPHPSPLEGEGKGGGEKGENSCEIFSLPIVWNSSGYDGMDSLKLLDGVVDIYMPDIKYSGSLASEHLSNAADYWDVVRPVIKEMYRQVGTLELDENGVAKKGLIIRHLVLPNGLSGTERVLKFIAEEISPLTHISLMSQYFPAHKAVNDPKINRRLTKEEWAGAESLLEKFGLINGWVQTY